MGYNNGINAQGLLSEIEKMIDSASEKYHDAGEGAGEEFIEGVVTGIRTHSKEVKSEIAKQFEEFNKLTNKFKTIKSVKQSDWKNVLELSNALLKSDKYAQRVLDTLSDVKATFKGIGEVSGLQNVVKELEKAGDALESVSWSEAGKNFKPRKKTSTKKPKVETPVVDVDPSPVVEVEKKKQKAISETTEEMREQAEVAAKAKEIASRMSKNSSIKGIKNLEEEAISVTRALAEMYDDGIRDTEKYITLQYKLSKILDKMGESYGGVRRSGAKDLVDFRSLIFDRIQQVTGTNIFDISSVMENLLGDSKFSLFNKSLSGLRMQDIAELLYASGNYGDWTEEQRRLTAGTEESTEELLEQAAAAMEEQAEAQKKLNEETKENILYHAGDLSNPSQTQKTYPLGHVRPSKSRSVFNGFTGLYTTEDVDGFWGTEWSGAPISTIDASQYNLFDARTDELATKAKEFFDNLNGTIYGYIEDFSTGELKRITDVKTIDELWADFNEVFKNVNMDFEAFSDFVKKGQSIVHGKSFADVEGLPDLDQGIVKTGEKSALQGVSRDIFNSDSFQTQILKMLGFEGIDLRGTKHNGTYTGGTVLFEIKPESIKTVNEKWSDVMGRNGYEIEEYSLKNEERRRQLAFDTAKAYSQQTEAVEESKKTLDDFMSKWRELSSQSDDKDAFGRRNASLLEGVSGETPTIDYDTAYAQLIANEEEYKQKTEETNRVNAERAKQLHEFVEASKSMFSGDMSAEEQAIMSDLLNQISIDGLSAADAIEELNESLTELRGQSGSSAPSIRDNLEDELSIFEPEPTDSLNAFMKEFNRISAMGFDESKLEKVGNAIIEAIYNGMSADEAVDNLRKEFETELNEKFIRGNRLFAGTGIEEYLTQSLNVPNEELDYFKRRIIEVFNIMQNAPEEGAKAFEELGKEIIEAGSQIVEIDNVYEDFMREYGKGAKTKVDSNGKKYKTGRIIYNEGYKAQFTSDEWNRLIKEFGFGRHLVSEEKANDGDFYIDQIEDELLKYGLKAFSDAHGNSYDLFRTFFDVIRKGRAWKQPTISLPDEEQGEINNKLNETLSVMRENANKSAEESIPGLDKEAESFEGVAKSAEKAAKAKEKFDKANKKVKDGADASSDSLDDEADSLDDVNRAAAEMPDTGDYERVTTYMDANGNPYGIRGSLDRTTADARVRTTDSYIYNDETGEWDRTGTVQTDDRVARIREMERALEEYYDIQNRIQRLRLDPSAAIHAAEVEKLETEDLVRANERLLDLGIDVNNIENQINLTARQRQALLDVELHARQEMYDVIARMEDKQATTAVKPYQKTVADELKKSAGIDTNIRLLGEDGVGSKLQAQVIAYRRLVDELVDLRLDLARDPELANDVDFSNRFADVSKRAQNARVEIEGVFKESQKLRKLGRLEIVGQEDVSGVQDLKSKMVEFAYSALEGEIKVKGFNKEGTQMYVTLNKGANAVDEITVALDGATGRLNAFSTGTSKATNEWKEFKKQATDGVKRMAGMYLGVNDIIRYGRQGVEYVKDIDLAMTELKKVTDETDESYKQFLKDASGTSAVIGSTIRDFTDATASFARLGYSMEEASSMAETAIIYKNVADGLDTVEESSESIISTMMAFGIEADDTMSIIDKFNAVGNNFAITSAGIGEALQRSASALFEAGNTIDESVALVTAAM